MDIIHHLKRVSEIGFCLRVQVEPTQIGPIERSSLLSPDTINNTNSQHNTNHQRELMGRSE
jgi:hypothetical protein